MENSAKKRGMLLFSHKILILLLVGFLIFATNQYIARKQSDDLSFGEACSMKELLVTWGDDGDVYVAGKLELLDINRATEEELMALPHIGVVLANRILEYREEVGAFASITELDEIVGIGEKTIDAIRAYICV